MFCLFLLGGTNQKSIDTAAESVSQLAAHVMLQGSATLYHYEDVLM